MRVGFAFIISPQNTFHCCLELSRTSWEKYMQKGSTKYRLVQSSYICMVFFIVFVCLRHLRINILYIWVFEKDLFVQTDMVKTAPKNASHVIYCNQWTETGPVCNSLFKQWTLQMRCRGWAVWGEERKPAGTKLFLRMFSALVKSIFMTTGKKAAERGLVNTLWASLISSFHVPDTTWGVICSLFLWLRQRERLWLQKSPRLRGWRLSLRNCYGFPKMCSHMLRVLSLQYSSIKGSEKSDYAGVGGWNLLSDIEGIDKGLRKKWYAIQL